MRSAQQFLQLDNPGTDAAIYIVASNEMPQLAQLTFVVAGDTDGELAYFGQVTAPVLWHNLNAEDRFSPSAHEAQARIVDDRMATEAYFNLMQVYSIDIQAELRNGVVTAPTTRPIAGSRWRVATTAEAERFLGAPNEGVTVGHIGGVTDAAAQPIGIKIDRRILCHHIETAGTTGSGKSNTNVNLIRSAQAIGAAVIVYDQKPDYCEIDQPNDELHGHAVAGIKNVEHWQLGEAGMASRPISVPVGMLDHGTLAGAIFWKDSEELQAETCEFLLNLFKDQSQGWRLDDFISFISKRDHKEAANDLGEREAFNRQVYTAIRNKLRLPGRIPSWVDADVRRGSLAGVYASGAGRQGGDDFFAALENGGGHVFVIRIGNVRDARSYALFLDYATRRAAEGRAAGLYPPVVHLIDEAADIFRAGNRRLRQQMTSVISEQVRKGRSLGIGFIISSQSAGDVPEEIRNNMNSIFAFRHRNPSILREVLPETAADLFPVAAKLRTGEAIVNLMGVPSPLRCRMLPSPARLYKPAWGG